MSPPDDGPDPQDAADAAAQKDDVDAEAAPKKKRWMPGIRRGEGLASDKLPGGRAPEGATADDSKQPREVAAHRREEPKRDPSKPSDRAGGPGPAAPAREPAPSIYKRINEEMGAQAVEASDDGPPGGTPGAGGGDARDGGDESQSTLQRLGVGFDKAAVRQLIERTFRVYDERDALPGLSESVLVAFYILGTDEEIEERYSGFVQALRVLDPRLVPMFRRDAGENVIVVTRRGHERERQRRLPVVLFLLTLATTVLSGASAWVAYDGSTELSRMLLPRYLGLGALTFALPLFFIMGVQEAARRIAARRHDVRLAWPWFIPIPPLLFFPSVGTFGSLAHLRDPIPDRKALFDIAASGPLAGFVAVFPVLVLGLLLTSAHAVPVPDGNDVALEFELPDGRILAAANRPDSEAGEATAASDADNASAVPRATFLREGGIDPRGYGGDVLLVGDLHHSLAIVRTAAQANQTFAVHLVSLGNVGSNISVNVTMRHFAFDGGLLVTAYANASVAPEATEVVVMGVPEGAARSQVHVRFELGDLTSFALGEPAAFDVVYDVLGRDEGYVIHPTALAAWTGFLLVGISLLPVGRFEGGMVVRAIFGEGMRWWAYGSIALLIVLSCAFPFWIHLALFIVLFVGTRYPPPLNDTFELEPRRVAWGAVLLVVFLASFVWVPSSVPGLDICARLFGL